MMLSSKIVKLKLSKHEFGTILFFCLCLSACFEAGRDTKITGYVSSTSNKQRILSHQLKAARRKKNKIKLTWRYQTVAYEICQFEYDLSRLKCQTNKNIFCFSKHCLSWRKRHLTIKNWWENNIFVWLLLKVHFSDYFAGNPGTH